MSRSLLLAIIGLVVLALAGFAMYGLYSLSTELAAAKAELADARAKAEQAEAELTGKLGAKTEESISLAGELRLEQQKNGSFESQLEDLSGTIGTLEKLAKTDPELLAKYSKVYFLNENYIPSKLSVIDSAYAFQSDRAYEIQTGAKRFIDDLLEDAKKDGLDLKVASSYRSFASQASLKSGYTVKYGSGANAFSADQGYSEHQLGTAVDFTTPAVGGTFAGFDKAEEYAWLTKNAWKYGFILSYPKENTYYQYEPWHWRFVGKELAERLHEDDEWFYDLDQRTIDGYLAELFD
jgi:D-alanyl-D-alanine carboxypeptidase